MLSMYSFKIKKWNTLNSKKVTIDSFLSEVYPDKKNKFEEGFVQDIINLFDLKLFKDSRDTMGGILEERYLNNHERTFDIMINGGTKGLKQYIIDEEGEKKEISHKEIVGLKFFARIWLPSHSYSGYLFIQRYSSISIKPLFDELIKEVFKNKNYSLVQGRTLKTTTEKRQKEFMRKSYVKEIIVTTYSSPYDTGGPDTTAAVISLKNFKRKGKREIDSSDVTEHLIGAGINLKNRYRYKTKYEADINGYKEEKTINEDDIFSLIPNTLIPSHCIDESNHPLFDEMRKFVSQEIEEIKKEAAHN